MGRTLAGLAGLWATLIVANSASAVALDSSLFSHKYEGDYPVGLAYQEFRDDAEFVVPPSSDGNVLSFHSTRGTGNNFWYYDWTGVVDDAIGYTYEARVKISPGGPQGLLGAVQFYMTDGNSHGGTDNPGTTVRLGQAGFSIPTPGGPDFLDGKNYADGEWHVVRAAQAPNSSDFTYWSDGVLLGTFPGGFGFPGTDSYFGDGSGDIGGRLVMIDYVRFDNTGAYAPVPEPVTSGLGAFVACAIVTTCRARRSHEARV